MALIASVGRATAGATAAITTTGAALLVAWTANWGSAGTLTDSQANTWTPLTLATWSTQGQGRLYYCEAPATSASHTFSFTGSDATLYVVAFDDALLHDARQSTANSQTAPCSAGAVTPVSANSLVIAAVGNSGGAAFSDRAIGSGFTLVGDIDGVSFSNQGIGLAYLFQAGGPSAVNPQWTGTGAAGEIGCAIVPLGVPPVEPEARVSQLPVEALVSVDAATVPARLSQLPLEVLLAEPPVVLTEGQLAQLPVEVLLTAEVVRASETRATQLVTELASADPSTLNVTQAAVEVAWQAPGDLRVTQLLIEIIKRPLGPSVPPVPPIYPTSPTGCGAGGEYPKLPVCGSVAYPLLPESTCMDASTFVVNMALQEVGISKALEALSTDTSQEAYCARLIYTDVVDTVLRDFPWNFATEYADLVWLAGSVEDPVNPDWTYTYTLPTDCVRVRRVCDPSMQRRYTATPIPFDLRADSTGLLDVLLANEPGGGQLALTDPPTISIEYTKRHTCVAQVNDAQFRECLVMKLAARLAKSLGRDSKDADRCLRNYALALPKAKTQHANDAEPQRPLDGPPDWLTGR